MRMYEATPIAMRERLPPHPSEHANIGAPVVDAATTSWQRLGQARSIKYPQINLLPIVQSRCHRWNVFVRG